MEFLSEVNVVFSLFFDNKFEIVLLNQTVFMKTI